MNRLASTLVPIFVAGVLSLSGCAVEDDNASSSSGSDANDAAQTTEPKKKSCGTKATDDCTPHVKSSGKVRVDTITYRVAGARAASQLGDDTYGLGETADGTFVIVDVAATNGKDESVTLTDVFKLEVGGKTYDPTNEGTVAAMGAGEEPFFLQQIGPDVTARGVVVFDIPTAKVGRKLELRLGELGFGSTHAYIRLPSL